MKKTLLTISAFLFLSSITTQVFSAGDEATIKKLSSMYKSGDDNTSNCYSTRH